MSEQSNLRQTILKAMAAPDTTMGRIEENAKAKVLIPVLQLLGWDPVEEMLFEFQLDAGTPDIVLACGRSFFAFVEAKYWGKVFTPLDWEAFHGYRRDLGPHVAVQTNGQTWHVFEGDAEEAEVLTLGRETLDADLGALGRVLSREVAEGWCRANPRPDFNEVLRRGLGFHATDQHEVDNVLAALPAAVGAELARSLPELLGDFPQLSVSGGTGGSPGILFKWNGVTICELRIDREPKVRNLPFNLEKLGGEEIRDWWADQLVVADGAGAAELVKRLRELCMAIWASRGRARRSGSSPCLAAGTPHDLR